MARAVGRRSSKLAGSVHSGDRNVLRRALERIFAIGREQKPLWWYPLWSLLGGLTVGFAISQFRSIDPGAFSFAVYEGGAEAARSFVSLAASSIATIISLLLSITVVTLQLASSQYSPRLIEHFLADRGIRASISLFLFTFAFAIATLLSVRHPDDEPGAIGQVPGISISLLVLLVALCLAALVLFVFRVTQSIRVETILTRVRDRTFDSLERRASDDGEGIAYDEMPEPDDDGVIVRSEWTGFFAHLDRDAIADSDLSGDVRVWLLISPGDFVNEGLPLAIVSGPDPEQLADEVRRWMRIDAERWIEADYLYGLRSMVDVALRALSPGINDPTTGIMAINRIGEVLTVAARQRPARQIDLDGGGQVFLAVRTWRRSLIEVLQQLALYGREDAQVVVAVIRMLRSLAWADCGVDRSEDVRVAVEVFEQLIDIERAEPDQRTIDIELDIVRQTLDIQPDIPALWHASRAGLTSLPR